MFGWARRGACRVDDEAKGLPFCVWDNSGAMQLGPLFTGFGAEAGAVGVSWDAERERQRVHGAGAEAGRGRLEEMPAVGNKNEIIGKDALESDPVAFL